MWDHASEAIELLEAGVRARFVVLSATLPESSDQLVAHGLEPVVCTLEMVEGLARAAAKAETRVCVHVGVDTGMGRVGIRPEEVSDFLARCAAHPEIEVTGLMSHFPRADDPDRSFSEQQIRVLFVKSG